MATLTVDEAKAILKESEKVPDFVIKGRKSHKTWRALIDGKDHKEELSRVEKIELSEDKWKARQKYSRSIKDTNERLMRPIDNVYSATGGSKNYEITSEEAERTLLTSLARVRGNQSLERWLKDNWMHVYHTDPQGIIFVEINPEKQQSYPTYKSINVIRNYKPNGQNLEWVLFEPKKIPVKQTQTNFQTGTGQTIDVWRLVDDVKEWRFVKEGNDYVERKDIEGFESFMHPFGKCPGLINSNLLLPGEKERLSPFDTVRELEQEMLRDQSIKTIVKFLNGFKNLVRPKVLCQACHGTKKDGTGNKCKSCDGTGFMINKDVTDEIILPIDLNNPDQTLPNADTLAAWIGLDTETWDQYDKELQLFNDVAQKTVWGSLLKSSESSGNKTQLEIWGNTQPVMSRLDQYSDVAEFMEWQITEWIANFLFPEKNKNQRISSIHYGRRYILDPPDEILRKYVEAKNNSAPVTILDRMLGEYITAKYRNDPENLRIQLLKKTLEPYVHYNIDQVTGVFGQGETQKKMLFTDWWETLGPNEFVKAQEKLQDDFAKWIEQRSQTLITQPNLN